jgi:hypothetical protein
LLFVAVAAQLPLKNQRKMGKAPPKWLPGERVKETILVQRKSVEQLRADRTLRKDKLKDEKSRLKARMDMKRKKRLATKKFMPAQVILQQAMKREANARRFTKAGEKFDTRAKVRPAAQISATYEKAKVALVMRAKGNMIAQEVRKGYERLGLDKLYKARLIRLNGTSHKLIQQLRPFSVVGYPTPDQLETLIRTRAAFWNAETKSKAYISGNMQVEQMLGEHNILTIEEMVDAIARKQPECIDKILSSIAPFDFHPPRKLYIERHRRTHQKLEVLNPASFAEFLKEELQHSHATKTA